MQTYRNAFGLEGKTCVVTGGSGGIGRAIALAFGTEGARVAVLDRDAAGAGESAAIIGAAGGEAVAVVCDVTDRASVEAAAREVEKALGGAEVLVNNAGIPGTGNLIDMPPEDWERVLRVNLTGYFHCMQVFGRGMVARRSGAMVHISSINAVAPIAGSGSYPVAKAGVSAMSHQLAAELGQFGVRSNTVLPGMMSTSMGGRSYSERPEVARARAEYIPLGRTGLPEDIAQAVLYLASPRAAYVSGAEILVDGALKDGLIRHRPKT